VSEDVLAIDVGATSIKFQRFSSDGTPVGKSARRATQYPCPPERLVSFLTERSQLWPTSKIGIGFPGTVSDGIVVDGANLARVGGAGTPIDQELTTLWGGFDLAGAMVSITGAEVIVDNDAAMAALGCASGDGTELFVTLGTGVGLALMRAGQLVRVRDVGDEQLHSDVTYDELLGERGRRPDEAAWALHVVSAVIALADEFRADTIHLAGGNARRLSPRIFGDWAPHVTIEPDQPALRGAWRSFYP